MVLSRPIARVWGNGRWWGSGLCTSPKKVPGQTLPPPLEIPGDVPGLLSVALQIFLLVIFRFMQN